MISWLFANKEWFFSGLGLALLTLIPKIIGIVKEWSESTKIITNGLPGNYYFYIPRPHSPGRYLRCPLKISRGIRGHFYCKLKIREFLYFGSLKNIDGTLFTNFVSNGSRTYICGYFQREVGLNSALIGVQLARSRLRVPLVSKVYLEKAIFDFEQASEETLESETLPANVRMYFADEPYIIYSPTQ
jgi:hypothetical protein